ncbi:hypothetical protein KP509_04G018700 [Ceratopteris richardii]|uniref:Secreted protein n=1 Tax=Ceratopteris richardii TaxID=49495 RepID=A0A8T2UT74_CERRI|nr:hypothetical protein KP509_04G018700 [Ceratopteris richardii]
MLDKWFLLPFMFVLSNWINSVNHPKGSFNGKNWNNSTESTSTKHAHHNDARVHMMAHVQILNLLIMAQNKFIKLFRCDKVRSWINSSESPSRILQ